MGQRGDVSLFYRHSSQQILTLLAELAASEPLPVYYLHVCYNIKEKQATDRQTDSRSTQLQLLVYRKKDRKYERKFSRFF
jgi:hypothetical protein